MTHSLPQTLAFQLCKAGIAQLLCLGQAPRVGGWEKVQVFVPGQLGMGMPT